MKATFIGKENDIVEFEMLFEADEIEKQIDAVYKLEKGKFAVDGFRKGKAPRKVIEAKYGKGVFLEDAINEMISDSYPDAISQILIRPVASPEIEVKEFNEGESLTVTIKVTVRPEFTLGQYKGLEIEKINPEITEKDVDEAISILQKRNARISESDKPAEMGNTVTIDYMGFIGDEQFEGGTANGQDLELGSGTFIPGFEEQLVGAKIDDELDVKVTFPEDYHAEDLAGKEAIFKVKVLNIKEIEMPVLDDEFAKDVSEFDTLDELKADYKTKLEAEAENKAEFDMKNALLDLVYENTDFNVPDAMVDSQAAEMMDEISMQLQYQGVKLEDYLGYMGKDIESFKNEIRPDAYKKMKTRLIVDEIAKVEGLEATQEEIDKELEGMSEHYNMEVEELKGMFRPEDFELITQDITNRKAIQLVYDAAVIK